MAVPEFELPNVGPGPDPYGLADLQAAAAVGVLLFQRDQYCTNCRGQVQDVADRYEEFSDRDADVVSIVPEPRSNVESWQRAYELPFPLLADPDARVGDAFEQPVRYGILGKVSDFFGRMPMVVILDLRGAPTIAWRHVGRSTFDRPSIDEVLEQVSEVSGA